MISEPGEAAGSPVVSATPFPPMEEAFTAATPASQGSYAWMSPVDPESLGQVLLGGLLQSLAVFFLVTWCIVWATHFIAILYG